MVFREVCHYTKRKSLFRILGSGKLRIGQFSRLNDPRESRARDFPIISRVDLARPDDALRDVKCRQLTEQCNKIALREWKVLCVTLHRPEKEVQDSESDSHENLWKKIYNQRLRQGYSHPRMWAQYGENHHGACLIFDGASLNSNINSELGDQCEIFQGRVIYNSELLTPIAIPYMELGNKQLADQLRMHYYRYYREIFLRKHLDWKDEVEYRWLIHSSKNSHEYVCIAGAIKAVIVGVDFPKEDEPQLIELCQSLNISAGRIDWHDGLPLPRPGSICQPINNGN